MAQAVLDAELALFVGPGVYRSESGARCQCTELVQGILVRMLGHDEFVRGDGEAAGPHPDLLVELIPDNRDFSLTRREADLAIRLARPVAGGMKVKARRIGSLAYGVYVSENALYFTESRPDTALARDVTRIHKFALQGTQVRYRGSADIDGTVWRGGQSDFRMNEFEGDLRILASQFDWTNEDFVDHKLYVLRESSTRRHLDTVSTLPNSARPEEIGKPNEALYGVRFLGDRAYAVTFLQIDPLYAIDLSDPEDPYIAGELEVTGFSDFLHPVTDDLLLGLGTGANGGVKLELFDVSDLRSRCREAAPCWAAGVRTARRSTIDTRSRIRRMSAASTESRSRRICTASTEISTSSAQVCSCSRFVTRTRPRSRRSTASDRSNRRGLARLRRTGQVVTGHSYTTTRSTTSATRPCGRRSGTRRRS